MDVTHFSFDRDYRILHVEGEYAPFNEPHVGKVLWDVYPDSIAAFGPVYEEAWREGHCYRVVACRGQALQVIANVHEDKLLVSVTVLTLEGLRETLELLEASHSAREA